MTFNQWCCGKSVDSAERLAFEAVWNEMVGAGILPSRVSTVLTDLYEDIDRRGSDCEEDWF